MIDPMTIINGAQVLAPEPRNYRHHEAIQATRMALATLEIMASLLEENPDSEEVFDALNKQLGEWLIQAGHAIYRLRQTKECLGEG